MSITCNISHQQKFPFYTPYESVYMKANSQNKMPNQPTNQSFMEPKEISVQYYKVHGAGIAPSV
jgi:hypothetical protein